MVRGSRWIRFLLLGSGICGACANFDSVDDACDPNGRVPGAVDELSESEEAAFDRMNCYRRVNGLGRAAVDADVQRALQAQRDYILSNPDAERLFGPEGPSAYLSQTEGEPSFTGISLLERLDSAGYGLAGEPDTSAREYLLFVDNRDPSLAESVGGPLLEGAAAMDGLMRLPAWREYAMQRSWNDGGLIEIPLDQTWLTAADVCDADPLLCSGGQLPAGYEAQLFYIVVVHTDPPVQRNFEPFAFPKPEQVDVLHYSMSRDQDRIDPATGAPPFVQIGYPISIFGSATSSDGANLGDLNVYGLRVEATVTDEDGQVLESRVVLPGDAPSGIYPGGGDLRRSAALYVAQPFAPNAMYNVSSRIETNESIYEWDFAFQTQALEDAGADPAIAPSP